MIIIYCKFQRCPEGRAVMHSSLERWIQILGRLNRKQFWQQLATAAAFLPKNLCLRRRNEAEMGPSN